MILKKNLKEARKLLLLLFLCLLLTSCRPKVNTQNDDSHITYSKIIFSGKPEATILAENAETPAEQQKGLMFRKTMDVNHGMLFVFDHTEVKTFWMKNTYIPLDIIFISEDMEIDSIAKNTKPRQTEVLYSSNSEVKFVLEVNAGFTDTHSINTGDRVEIKYK